MEFFDSSARMEYSQVENEGEAETIKDFDAFIEKAKKDPEDEVLVEETLEHCAEPRKQQLRRVKANAIEMLHGFSKTKALVLHFIPEGLADFPENVFVHWEIPTKASEPQAPFFTVIVKKVLSDVEHR